MRKKSKNLTILLVFILSFPLIFNYNVNLSNDYTYKGDKPNTSATYDYIMIDALVNTNTSFYGNWSWARAQPWCTTGNGTKEDPYIIENVTIIYPPAIDCLTIKNSREYFIVRNCTFKDIPLSSFAGLRLNNVTNGQIINNLIYNNSYGIRLYDSHDNIIMGNTVNNNTFYGIYLQGEPMIRGCYNNTISGNTVNNNSGHGIALIYNCDFNNITGNTVNDNGASGILINGQDGPSCDNNTVLGNTVYDNTHGIFLKDSNDYNNITGNTVYDNTYGIFLEVNSDYNNITGNIVNDNEIGIRIEQCIENIIQGNIANNNTMNGIYLLEDSINNTISGNNINNNEETGIFIEDDSNNNTISGNNINNNEETGITLGYNSEDNLISGNILYNNTWGIYIESGSFNNSFYENFLLKNDKHAFDDGTDNKWNSTTIGNYWDNHTGPDAPPQDGIVDNPYTYISGIAKSIDYLPIAEDGAPQITINSPSEGDAFSLIAPNYNVIITDDYLDTTWYTLDGGSNNYTFTENGIINQTAWDDMDDGTITLTFYARDIPGYIGSAEVDVIKDTLAPVIIINSPDEGDRFGKTAPLFNITVTDDNLDVMWYSIDGGLNNFTFTNNGTIDQTAWYLMSEGNVNITFYARDIPGNIGTAEVMIVKDFEAPTININSPTTGEFFGSNAPSFNVRMTDDYLDTMWYTLDGGLHNYTFTGNGTLEQSAWNAMDDGTITLQFYANDTLGHIGSAGVNIIKDTVAPVININSPSEDEKFGKNAPLFNITVIEDNLDLIWYSFDGGLTTYTITDNAVFDQEAWGALPKGEVTITFYAIDLAGNEVTESVTVIKSIPSGGVEPGVIVIIVVSSVAGAVVVAAVVYVFLKKRGVIG